MKTWQRWQDAQTMLQKKREMEARLLWANKPDKLQQAKDEIMEVGTGVCWVLLSSFPLCSAPELKGWVSLAKCASRGKPALSKPCGKPQEGLVVSHLLWFAHSKPGCSLLCG